MIIIACRKRRKYLQWKWILFLGLKFQWVLYLIVCEFLVFLKFFELKLSFRHLFFVLNFPLFIHAIKLQINQSLNISSRYHQNVAKQTLNVDLFTFCYLFSSFYFKRFKLNYIKKRKNIWATQIDEHQPIVSLFHAFLSSFVQSREKICELLAEK